MGIGHHLPFLPEDLPQNPERVMIIVGFGGQFLFAMRFIIQWITSEGAKKALSRLRSGISQSAAVLFCFYAQSGGKTL